MRKQNVQYIESRQDFSTRQLVPFSKIYEASKGFKIWFAPVNKASFSIDNLKNIPTFGSVIQNVFIIIFFRQQKSSLFDKKRYQNIKKYHQIGKYLCS